MAKFAIPFSKGSGNVRQICSVNADGTRPRRGILYELDFGCTAGADDNQYQYEVRRVTGAPTASGVTPNPTTPGDVTELDAYDTVTADAGSYSGGAQLYRHPLNGRASFRWQTDPETGLQYPATASNGLSLGLTAASTVTFAGTAYVNEQ